MDEKSSYLLKIKITSTTMRKDVSAFCVEDVLDLDTINYCDFIAEYGKKYPWAHNELLKMYYVDDCTTIKLVLTKAWYKCLQNLLLPSRLILSCIFIM